MNRDAARPIHSAALPTCADRGCSRPSRRAAETFLPSGAEPLPWSKFPDTAAACNNHPKIEPGTLVPLALAKFGSIGEQAGDNQSGQNITNVLVAQNGKLARYLVGFDLKEFDLIRQNKLYDAINLPAKWDTEPGNSTKLPTARSSSSLPRLNSMG